MMVVSGDALCLYERAIRSDELADLLERLDATVEALSARAEVAVWSGTSTVLAKRDESLADFARHVAARFGIDDGIRPDIMADEAAKHLGTLCADAARGAVREWRAEDARRELLAARCLLELSHEGARRLASRYEWDVGDRSALAREYRERSHALDKIEAALADLAGRNTSEEVTGECAALTNCID